LPFTIYHLFVSFYPPKINERFSAPENAGEPESANAVGAGASFVCGTFVRFYLDIDVATKQIREAKFQSNGCGFVIAAADVLAKQIAGRKLTELHGLGDDELRAEIETSLEPFPAGRKHCAKVCFEALHSAFADFRRHQVEEFAGEKALICTCFGVSEEFIEKLIADNSLETVEEVTDICGAGGGCGSCQFLIQELIDVEWR
jgi:NifU-like protein